MAASRPPRPTAGRTVPPARGRAATSAPPRSAQNGQRQAPQQAADRRSRPTGPAKAGAVPPRRAPAARHTYLTGRAAVLALVVGVLVVLLAYPLREYVEHRARVAALEQEGEAREQRVDELTQQIERLNDPAYIRAQARDRLHFVMPGETGFVVEENSRRSTGDAAEAGAGLPDEQPWYGRLWSSVQAASGTGPSAGRTVPPPSGSR
jgi:cell division protein FtsB